MDIIIKTILAICIWAIAFVTGRFFESVMLSTRYADTTDRIVFASGTIFSLGAAVWIAVV